MCDYCDLLRRLRARALHAAGGEAGDPGGRGVIRRRSAALPSHSVAASDSADIDDSAAREASAGIRQAPPKADWAAAECPKAATSVARFDVSGTLNATDGVGATAQNYHAA